MSDLSKPDISNAPYEAIMADAYTRQREYERSMAGRAVGQMIDELNNTEWWILTSAYQAGLDAAKKRQEGAD